MRYVALLLIAALLSPLVAAAATAKPYHYQRVFYYTDSATAKKAFYAHWRSIDVLAPQSYAIESDGTLSGSVDPDIIAFAKKHAIKIIPLVTNDAFSQDSYQNLFADPVKEQQAIFTLITEADNRGYAGWQLDFEQIHIEFRDQFTSFVALAADSFHKAGLSLSVAVIAKISDNPSDYKGMLYQNLIGAYDYAALAKSADFISLMSYDDPTSTGPVVQFSWMKQVLAYALANAPANKITLGIPLYYWQWNDISGKLIGIGGIDGVKNVFANHKDASIYYDQTEQENSVYYLKGGVPYTLWYENGRSVAAKIALVKKYKLYGVSFWQLGQESATIYNSIQE